VPITGTALARLHAELFFSSPSFPPPQSVIAQSVLPAEAATRLRLLGAPSCENYFYHLRDLHSPQTIQATSKTYLTKITNKTI